MATVLKDHSSNSPGIAVFSSNEFFYGVVGNNKQCKERIQKLVEKKYWIFGLHINGFIPKKFDIPDFIYFVLCPNKKSDNLNIKQSILPWSAELFVKTKNKNTYNSKKVWDLSIISRISTIKRFKLSLSIIEELISLRPELKINIIGTYNSLDKEEFKYVKEISSRLRNLLKSNVSLNIMDSALFGLFPTSNEEILDTLSKSRSILITSQLEGGPRVLTEAASLNVPIFVCKDIQSNLNTFFDQINISKINIDPKLAAKDILNYFEENTAFKSYKNIFNSSNNELNFKKDLISLLKKYNFKNKGIWYLYNLNMRLPGHSRMINLQILYDYKLFLEWCDWIEKYNPMLIDEKLELEHKRLKMKFKNKLILKIYSLKKFIKNILLFFKLH